MANGLIGKVTAGGGTHLIASTAYFTCATAGATAAKIAKAADISLDSLTVITGMTIYVKFDAANTKASPTLTLQTSGGTELLAAKPIMRYGTTATYQNAAGSWRSGAVVALTYDGTNWVEVSSLDDNNTYYYESCYVSTAAGTAAKVGTCSNYALQKGYLQVLIMNANTSQSALTLNINGTGAKPIYINGAASSASNYTLPKAMYLVYYDGTNFYFRTDGVLTAPGSGAAYSTAANGALTFGTLPIAQGGTGKTSAADAWTALGGGASGKHADSYFAKASHDHGNIASGGTMSSTGVALANGDYLLFSDASNSGKIERTSITFNGSTDIEALTKKGTWKEFVPAKSTGTDYEGEVTNSNGVVDLAVTGNSSSTMGNISQISLGEVYTDVGLWINTSNKNILIDTDSNGDIEIKSSGLLNLSAGGGADNQIFLSTSTTAKSKLTVGTTSQSAAPTGSITIHDTRNYTWTPTSLDKGVNWYFTQTGSPDTNKWWSIMHLTGWTGDYNAWELAGPSHNSDQRTTPLYVRTGRTTNGWGSWRKIYDTSNKPSVGAHSYTPAGTISVQTSGSTVAADDITAWTTNTPTAVTKKTVVTSATVSNEILTISTGDSVTVTAGTAASLSYTARTVKSGDAAYKFSGTAASLTHTVS